MRGDRSRVMIVGGASAERGGVEVYVERLQNLWPSSEVDLVGFRYANTSIKKARRGLLFGLWTSVVTLARNCCAIRRESKRSGRLTVWYQYGNGVDLLHILVLGLLPRVSVVVSAHCGSAWAHLRSRPLQVVVGRILGRCALFLVLSDDQKDLFSRLGVRTVRKVSTLLDEALLDKTSVVPWRERHAGSLVFIGRVSREKGIFEALHAIESLARADHQLLWRFDIFGAVDGDIEAQLHAVLHNTRSSNVTIEIHGRVEQSVLSTALERSRYLLYLSTMDAYPLAVLEGIACGTIPVVYHLPGTSEIVRRWGGVEVPVGDTQSAVAAILRLEQGVDRVRIRRDELVESLSPDVMRSAIVEMFGARAGS